MLAYCCNTLIFRPSIKYAISQSEAGVTSSAVQLNANATGTLDRSETSDREAVRPMIPFAAALGHGPFSLPLSQSAIQRLRKKARKECAERTLIEYNPSYSLTLFTEMVTFTSDNEV